MKSRFLALQDLTKLIANEPLSEEYVRYIAGFAEKKQYRHSEIESVKAFIGFVSKGESKFAGFLYGYEIPQLNKEFDLLKITHDVVINIELKSRSKDPGAMARQLIQNEYYLKMLKRKVVNYLFIASENVLYRLIGDSIAPVPPDELNVLLDLESETDIDLDKVFSPSSILVSPLNNPERFTRDEYLLTENQHSIEMRILSEIDKVHEAPFFYAIKGNPGTGKTLLLYDIAKRLCERGSVLVIHSGKKCAGHLKLEESIKNLHIIEAKALRLREIKASDYVLVDESQRLYESALESVIKWAKRTKTICVFSLDADQRMSHQENNRETVQRIIDLCDKNSSNLTNKIRTNKEIALFITCLFDLSKMKKEYAFPNVRIVFEPDRKKAIDLARNFPCGYQYISYTPSTRFSSIDDQESELNTHRVIGQEFDRVVMILDRYFYYDGQKLRGREHPNPDYIFEKLLYQGLTRAKEGIAIIITEEEVLAKVLTLFPSCSPKTVS